MIAAYRNPDAARRQLRRELFDDVMLDKLMAATDERGVALAGDAGFLPEIIKAVLERGMQAELTDHLGYEKGDPGGNGSGNSRNGTTPENDRDRGRRYPVGSAAGSEFDLRVRGGAQRRPPPGRIGGHDHQLGVLRFCWERRADLLLGS